MQALSQKCSSSLVVSLSQAPQSQPQPAFLVARAAQSSPPHVRRTHAQLTPVRPKNVRLTRAQQILVRQIHVPPTLVPPIHVPRTHVRLIHVRLIHAQRTRVQQTHVLLTLAHQKLKGRKRAVEGAVQPTAPSICF